MPTKLVASGREHVCSVCGFSGPWTESWCWYGSWKDLEDNKPIEKFCSDSCRDASIANGVTPPVDEDLDDMPGAPAGRSER